jgi:CDP-6-deoxy-D-xylo-4-hexulose-3-dehydrase
LQRLPAFIEARKQNWEYLRRGLADLEHIFDFSLPTHAIAWIPPSPTSPSCLNTSTFSWDQSQSRSTSSWFGFMLRVKPNAPFTHSELCRHLDDHKIGNRMLFGGNLLRQPVFVQLRQDNPRAIRVVGRDGQTLPEINSQAIAAALPGAEEIMNTALFLGTYPGLTTEQLDYEIRVIRDFVANNDS